MRKEIPKEETYNYYGEAERRLEIRSSWDHGAFIMALSSDVPRDGVCKYGRVVYTMEHKPLKAGHTKTEPYLDYRRWIDARFA